MKPLTIGSGNHENRASSISKYFTYHFGFLFYSNIMLIRITRGSREPQCCLYGFRNENQLWVNQRSCMWNKFHRTNTWVVLCTEDGKLERVFAARKNSGVAMASQLCYLPFSIRKSSVVDTKQINSQFAGQSLDQPIVCTTAKVGSATTL